MPRNGSHHKICPFDETIWLAKHGVEYDLPRFNVYPLIKAGSVHLIIAPPKHGKSFVVLELAWSITTGEDFFGRPVDVAGPMLMIAGEGADETRGRLEARRRRSGGTFPNGLALYPRPVAFGDPESVRDLIVWAKPMGFAAFSIDTASRCGAGDEGPEDMPKFVEGVTWLQQETGATIFILHHTPKGNPKTARGHTSLPAAFDSQWEMTKTKGGVYTFSTSFSRFSGSEGEELGKFKIENVVLGVNSDGREVGYGVVVPVGVEAAKPVRAGVAEQAMILRLAHEGHSPTAIAVRLGGNKQRTLERVKLVLEEVPGSGSVLVPGN